MWLIIVCLLVYPLPPRQAKRHDKRTPNSLNRSIRYEDALQSPLRGPLRAVREHVSALMKI